jgi:UDP-2,4-diacetamido-2,4,6-trideoxy-beta-L-altropyranose hydrolase
VEIAIRADASVDIGTGHVMRCLALAEEFRRRGAKVLFICRESAGDLCDFLAEEYGLEVERISNLTSPRPDTANLAGSKTSGSSWREDAIQTVAAIQRRTMHPDLLVIDHYGIDRGWENSLRPLVKRILVIDDLANRPHDCDVLLDQNLHDAVETRYAGLVADSCRVFVGPRYALLRTEFDQVTAKIREFGLRRMMVFFGGTDPSNEALKVLRALGMLGSDAPEAKFVLGPANPHGETIFRAAKGVRSVEILPRTNHMGDLIAEADLGLGTCGGAAWERCVLGLPSLVVVNAENQRDDTRILHNLGAVRNLGEAKDVSAEDWASQIAAFRNDSALLTRMSRAAIAVMRGRRDAVREFWEALEGDGCGGRN